MTSEAPKRKKKIPTPQHILDAWERYTSNPEDHETKQMLVEHYQFLVRNIMKSFWTKKPAILEMDDLLQAGNLGLLQALDRYQLDSEASFETFAQRRVLGAMLDEINALDWTPRNVRKHIRTVIEAESKLLARGEDINLVSLAKESGLTEHEVATARRLSHKTFILPVDQAAMQEFERSSETGESSINEYFGIGMGNNSISDDGMEFRISTLDTLTIQERQVIYLKFYCNEQVGHIAKILGIPAPRVSAISRRAIEKLRRIVVK